MIRTFRIELWCGSSEDKGSLRSAEKRYLKADKIARKFNIGTYFEVNEDHDEIHADGYIYPNENNIFEVLDALEKEGVEFDNIDVPESLVGSPLEENLMKRYPERCGVNIDTMSDIQSESKPDEYINSFGGFNLNSKGVGRGWHFDPYRHALAARGIRSRAIENPLADPGLYDEKWYSRKGKCRKFVGSGLEGVESRDIIDTLVPILEILNGSYPDAFDTESEVEMYHGVLKSIFGRDFNIPVERLLEMRSNMEDLFEVEAIYVTGSRVTGFYRPSSDVDVYIQFKDRKEFHPPFMDDIDMDHGLGHLLEALYLGLDITTGDDMKIPDNITGKRIKLDITKISIEPPTVPVIRIWEGEIR